MTKENLTPQPDGFTPDEEALRKQARFYTWQGLQGEDLGLSEREAIEAFEFGALLDYALDTRIENRLKRTQGLQPEPPQDPRIGQ